MRVEYLRAWDDNTWDTEVYSVPFDRDRYDTTYPVRLQEYAQEVLGLEARHRKVVLWAVYDVDPHRVMR